MLDELATIAPATKHRAAVDRAQLAGVINGMCRRWGVSPQVVSDDSIFAHGDHAPGSIATSSTFKASTLSLRRRRTG